MPAFDFASPPGEDALAPPHSVSWRVFRNPLALYIGGITAVLLELAEPRVRSGVWDHTTFRTDPLTRMRRTGLAAMITVYGARGSAERMIARVRRMHSGIEGVTPGGVAYRADDPHLLCWVHATALFGFMEAYHRYVRPLSSVERDSYIADGAEAATLYGAHAPPTSENELRELFVNMQPCLEASEIIHEFLSILARLSLFPAPLRPLNSIAIRAAIGLLPAEVRTVLRLDRGYEPPPGSSYLLRWAGRQIDLLPFASSPAARACVRLGLPADHLVPER
ncbi:MAG: DUF2236 domain-containing protein [Verrucomicrobiae bacterium]|nr:DUF2236 domain-containing protein [Verrucomicrobiae bacterium]